MIRLFSTLTYIIYSVFNCSFLQALIVFGAGGYSNIYLSDAIAAVSRVAVFKRLRKVATRFKRQ